MTIYRISTVSVSVYGDGSDAEYSVNLADLFPNLSCPTVEIIYTTHNEVVQVNPTTTITYSVADPLTYTQDGNVLVITLPSAPATWLAPYAGPSAAAFTFLITVRY